MTRPDGWFGGYLSLFSSLSTLLCCALPSLLVLFGLGATVAAFLSAVPWLVALSRHKNWVFAVSGVLIAGNLMYQRTRVCTAASCESASRLSRVILWISGGIYVMGFFTAYLLGPILARFD